MNPDMGRPFDPGFDRPRATAARHACGRGWKPLEIAAVVFGFALYWPLGLAVIGWKCWQKKSGYEGDLFSFTREKWDATREKWDAASNWSFGACASEGRNFAARSWRNAGFGSSGNHAFDEWRAAELARLEEERQKLVAAEREFAEFLENLRRARDREEFDRFMQERRNRQSGAN